MIRIANLTKRYGTLTAVDDLSLTVRPGEIYGFLGPNGAGKSTTIRILAGLLQPTSGAVEIAGVPLAERPEDAKRLMGYISDEPHPYDRLTGREFLMTVAALYGVDGGERARRVEQELERFNLAAWGDELSESYSHGMKQKLMIASALVHRPAVLVADEPMVGLDPASAARLRELFRSLAAEGRTVLLATHILDIAERLCDRIGIVSDGRLRAEGTLDELRVRTRLPGGSLEGVFLAVTAPAVS